MTRPAALQRFLDQSAADLTAATTGAAAKAALRAMEIWRRPGAEKPLQPGNLPVCDWISPALDLATTGPRAALAQSFAGIQKGLVWRRRQSAQPSDSAFWNGHANAMILGPGGLEERSDIWVGATVMAPGTVYQDHDHPPEEVYLSLAPGEWWNAQMDWTDPGPTGAIYNPPGIRHAMRAGQTPFLALWYLPV
jgi:quercetin dioxygenase-like cupin family protein